MDDPTQPGIAGPQADNPPGLEREDLARKLNDLGKRLVLDEHLYWRLPEGWTEAAVRDLAAQMGMPLDVMAHLAVATARGDIPGRRSPSDAGVPRFDFEAREGSAAIQQLRNADHTAGLITKPIRCRGRGCRRTIARPRINPDAVGGLELALIGPVSVDPSTRVYVFGSGRPSRASDVYLAGFGQGQLDPAWTIDVRCSCGHEETLYVGRALHEASRLV